MGVCIDFLIQRNVHMKIWRQTVFSNQKSLVHHWFWKRANFVVNDRSQNLCLVKFVNVSVVLHSMMMVMMVVVVMRVRMMMHARHMMNRRQKYFLRFKEISPVTKTE